MKSLLDLLKGIKQQTVVVLVIVIGAYYIVAFRKMSEIGNTKIEDVLLTTVTIVLNGWYTNIKSKTLN